MKPRVLIVDDSKYTVDMVGEILEEEFEIVGTTGNGDEAIERYRKTDPDIVVMDLTIPGIDGVTATARIKEIDPDSNVLVMTSLDNVAKRREAVDAGADGYISKPFDVDAFLESMRSLAPP